MSPPPRPQRQPELPHMPEKAASRTLKIRLSGHHPQKRFGGGGGARAGKASQTSAQELWCGRNSAASCEEAARVS